ncbi:MAG: type II toxin-antitoxin system VapC family toxin [Thermoleophilaceae bacterium]
MTIVLDAWAVIELLRGGAPGQHVRRLLEEEVGVMSSINLGEVHYALIRTHGEQVADGGVEGVRQAIRVEDPDWPLVRSAARIKARGGLSYADAFCLATARKHGAAVVTGDPEILVASGQDEAIDLRSVG